MINESLEARSNALFHKLVPSSGRAETVEGEMIRAISRIVYRYQNDGDYFYTGYGCETAGNSHAYLVVESPLAEELTLILDRAVDTEDDDYEAVLGEALEVIVAYVEGRGGNTTPNTTDSLDVPSLFEDEGEEEEDYWDAQDTYGEDEEDEG